MEPVWSSSLFLWPQVSIYTEPSLEREGLLYTAIAFWALGQTVLVLVGKYYNLITNYNIHEHIEKDNVAVGIGFAGALIGIGNLLARGFCRTFYFLGRKLNDLCPLHVDRAHSASRCTYSHRPHSFTGMPLGR